MMASIIAPRNPKNFVTPENVIKSLKAKKNCKGFDRIPVRILTDGMNVITPVLTYIFNLIYKQKGIPDQWRLSKVVPL